MVIPLILIGGGLIGLGITRILQKGRDQYEAAQDAGVEDPLYDPWYPGKKLIEDVKETPPEISIGIMAVAAVGLVLLLKKR